MRHALRILPILLALLACQPAFSAVVLTLDPAERQPDGSYLVRGTFDINDVSRVELVDDAFTAPAGIVLTSLLHALGLAPFDYSATGLSGFSGDMFLFSVPAGHPGGAGRYDLIDTHGIVASANFLIPNGNESTVPEPSFMTLAITTLVAGWGCKRASERCTKSRNRSAA